VRATVESPPSLHLVHRCTAASTSARGLWLVRPFFPTWPNKKGTHNACLKRDLFLFFIALLDFYFYFSHFPAHSFSFFHPSTLPNAQWLCPVCGKNAPVAMRVVSFFPIRPLRARSRKMCKKRTRGRRWRGRIFFYLVNTMYAVGVHA